MECARGQVLRFDGLGAVMRVPVSRDDVIGLVRPAVDAHTLGITSIAALLSDCRIRAIIADKAVREAVERVDKFNSIKLLRSWICEHRISRLGVSYRLDPQQGEKIFNRLFTQISRCKLLADQGGPLKSLYFAGLPETCRKITREHGSRVEVFSGDEMRSETLEKLGIESLARPAGMVEEIAYDEARLAFAHEWIAKGEYLKEQPIDRSGYNGFGSQQDRLVNRLRHSARQGLLPLMRAHAGAYLPDRLDAFKLFLEWCRKLADTGFLDILSIGTSQLSQSRFGEDWHDHPNGGGVPINSAEEFRAAWQASRPMLVRTYAGTSKISELARMYEKTINMAWHALSFWWFCQIDGRGPLSVRENLQQHLETLQFVAQTGKPFEPNVPHHFGFRGADDVTYVVSAVLAARTAKALGVRYLILQNMLNTPKYTWGIQDLAKSRAMISLVRELEDENFRVFLQPRAGLAYFSSDLRTARVQLAAVTAMMDDIEPHNRLSPELIHVVSFSEGSHLADPPTIDESIKITRSSLAEYRRLKENGKVPALHSHPEVLRRQEEITRGACIVLRAIGRSIARPFTAQGLYEIFVAGFLPVPYLGECLEEFARAVRWQTKVIQGGVKVVDERSRPISPEERAQVTAEFLMK